MDYEDISRNSTIYRDALKTVTKIRCHAGKGIPFNGIVFQATNHNIVINSIKSSAQVQENKQGHVLFVHV